MSDKVFCKDGECSRKSTCQRFNPLAPHDEIGEFKEWRGCECHFFSPREDELSPQEIRFQMREVENDARKDLQ